MKISELKTFEHLKQEPPIGPRDFPDYQVESGTFVGVRFDKSSQDQIKQFCDDNKIPNALPREKIHVTLLYSKKPCPNFKPDQTDYPMITKPDHFEIWKSEHIEGKPNCLVLKLDCKELEARHKHLMIKHQATFDYDVFTPHMSLSYDVGDLKAENLPDFPVNLTLEKEYTEALKTDYKADDMTKPYPDNA